MINIDRSSLEIALKAVDSLEGRGAEDVNFYFKDDKNPVVTFDEEVRYLWRQIEYLRKRFPIDEISIGWLSQTDDEFLASVAVTFDSRMWPE